MEPKHPGTGALSAAKLKLLADLRKAKGPGGGPAEIPRRTDPGAAVASHAQQALWFLDQFAGPGTSAAYNLPFAIRLRGPLDLALLARSSAAVIARHEALRTTFEDLGDRIVQRVSAPGAIELPVRDVDPAVVAQELAREACRPFDLTAGPLLRACAFRLAPDQHAVMFCAHHMVFDGMSVPLFLRELAEGYRAGRHDGASDDLPEPPIQYGDWAEWQRGPGRKAELDRQLGYWRGQLADASALLELPTDRPRGTTRSFEGREVGFTLPGDTAQALDLLCRDERATLFTAVLAAYQVLLARYSGQRDICVGVPVSGRSHTETQRLIGFFVNTVVMRGIVDEKLTFRQLLGRTREVALAAFDNQEVAFDRLVGELRPERTGGHNPLFQAYLDVTAEKEEPPQFPGLDCELLRLPGTDAKFDLSLGVTRRPGGLDATFDFRADLFDTATIQRMAGHFGTLLQGLAAHPDRPVGRIPQLSEQEHREQSAAESGSTVEVEDETLAEALAAQAARTPDEVAVRCEGEQLSYRQLDARSNRLARVLIDRGAGPGTVVALAVPRSLDLIVALGAIVRTGAAYLPLDPDHPADRLRFTLSDARPVCVLAVGATADAVPPGPARVLLDDAGHRADAASRSATPLAPDELLGATHPLDAAYVIYTSGSTGRPKGVLVPHRGIVNRLRWMQDEYRLGPGERVLHKTPASFDVSVWELFWPLLVGATMVVARPDGHWDPYYLAGLVAGEGVTTVHFVPSMLEVFLGEPAAARCTGLRRVLCSGEALDGRLAARFHAALPRVELHNLYGPTEASVDVTSWRCDPRVPQARVPIGRPVWNTAARVLDAGLQPVPAGCVGELYLSGAQLALGYLARPGLTADRFLPDPWGPPGTRMYRTGDLARLRADGALLFLGRTDHQVKVRGLRIELGEIEAVLQRHPSVGRALVLVRSDRPGEQRLTAYLTGCGDALPEPEELRALAADALPGHMVPSAFVVLPGFPVTLNGKVDREALPAPEPAAPETAGQPEAGRGGPGEPGTEAAGVLCGLYAELLGLEQVGPHDDFFALGGDSIGSIQLVGRARRAGVLFSARQVFAHKTPAALAAVAHAATAGPGQHDQEGLGRMRLTPVMRWWRALGGPTAGFHQSVLLRTPRDLRQDQLAAMLQALLDRHGMLRARLTPGDGGVEELVVPEPGAVSAHRVLTRVDVAGLTADALEEETERRSTAAARELVPEQGHMVRALWFDAGPDEPGRLLLAAHHLVVDAVSWRILKDDLAQAWQAVQAGRPPLPDPVPTSFPRWARLLAERAAGPGRGDALAYWNRMLATADPLPLDRPAEPVRDTVATTVELDWELPPELTDPVLRVVPTVFRAGPDHVLLTGLALALARWCSRRCSPGHGAVLVNLEGHGREESLGEVDLSRTVGWFTSLYPVRLDLGEADPQQSPADGPAVGQALKRVKEQLRTVPDGGLGYGMLRYLSDEPVNRTDPQIGFNYLGRFTVADSGETGRDWDSLPGTAGIGGSMPDPTPVPNLLDIVALTEDRSDGPWLTATFSWPAGILTEPAVRELAGLWTDALQALVRHAADPDAGGVTPSDLALKGIDQDEIDELAAEIALDWEDL